MKRICIILGTLTVMGFFQNCQQATTFGSKGDSSAKATGVLTPVVLDDQEDAAGQIVQPPVVQPPVTQPPVRQPTIAKEDCKKKDRNPAASNGRNDDRDRDDDEADDRDERLYVCILKGAGKSIKLGMADAALAGQNQIPDVLCMSRNACLEIAGAKFEVEGAYQRGYCKNPGGNPHVEDISDSDMKEKVARIGG